MLVCTPDKDLAQCVRAKRVVQLDRRSGTVLDEDGVRARYGVSPASIPDWLALVGDSADGFPGLAGWGKQSAASVLATYEHLSAIPDDAGDWDPALRRRVRSAPALGATLREHRPLAELFLLLATLRCDSVSLGGVGELTWTGPQADFPELCEELRAPRLAERAERVAGRRITPRG